MIDNFEIVKKVLEFNTPTDFYFIEILKRRKDPGNEHLSKGSVVVDNFYIYSESALEKYKPIIVEKCEQNNARAYIRVTKRDNRQIALKVIERTAMYVAQEQYRSVSKVYARVCGNNPGKDKRWIIDVDDVSESQPIEEFLKEKEIEFTKIPMVNGVHYVVKPFDTREYNKKFTTSVHRDNQTLLYYSN